MQSDDPYEEWWRIIDEVKTVLRWKTVGLGDTSNRARLDILDTYIDEGGMDRLIERVNKEKLKNMISAKIDPKIKVYQEKKGERLYLDDLSQGERATILLAILMNQQGGPLIIDQPEEDLDNRIISEIVDMVRRAKSDRQIIFATHNANMVVNGDAELVVSLAGGKPLTAGAIDVNEVRNSITEIMEGGKDAFELRRQKYNF